MPKQARNNNQQIPAPSVANYSVQDRLQQSNSSSQKLQGREQQQESAEMTSQSKRLGRPQMKGRRKAAAKKASASLESEKIQRERTEVACVGCKRSHSKCDCQRPCKECIKKGEEHLCVDAPRKKDLRKMNLNDSFGNTSVVSPQVSENRSNDISPQTSPFPINTGNNNQNFAQADFPRHGGNNSANMNYNELNDFIQAAADFNPQGYYNNNYSPNSPGYETYLNQEHQGDQYYGAPPPSYTASTGASQYSNYSYQPSPQTPQFQAVFTANYSCTFTGVIQPNFIAERPTNVNFNQSMMPDRCDQKGLSAFSLLAHVAIATLKTMKHDTGCCDGMMSNNRMKVDFLLNDQ